MLVGVPTDPLIELADELFSLPLSDFTPARDARAKELKGQDKELSARVKALRKPSLAAWVLNLLVRRDAEQVEQVLAVGEALREAQANLDGDELRALTRQRRQVTTALATRARTLAREEGQKVTEAVADQVEATLTAALLDAGAAAALRSGMLVAPLAATGVDAVDAGAAVAVPDALGFTATVREPEPPGRPELRVVPDPDADAKRRRAAEERLAAAEAEVAQAASELEVAGTEVSDLEARSMQLVSEMDELRRRLAELEAAAEEVDDELEEAEEAQTVAQDALAEAERGRAAAAAALEALDRADRG